MICFNDQWLSFVSRSIDPFRYADTGHFDMLWLARNMESYQGSSFETPYLDGRWISHENLQEGSKKILLESSNYVDG